MLECSDVTCAIVWESKILYPEICHQGLCEYRKISNFILNIAGIDKTLLSFGTVGRWQWHQPVPAFCILRSVWKILQTSPGEPRCAGGRSLCAELRARFAGQEREMSQLNVFQALFQFMILLLSAARASEH